MSAPQPSVIQIKTQSRSQMINITEQVAAAIPSGFSGVCHLFCLHTTAALTINENADPDVVHDMLGALDRLVPWSDPDFQHLEGNSAAHLKSSLLGPSLQVQVHNGKLTLGTWQGIFFCEFDGPRSRRVSMQLQHC